ncbi:glucose-6-phosphate isomerase family protein [Candidatus Altiarchaeota archaeon]
MTRDLEFGGNTYQPAIRHLNDMKDVVYDQSWTRKAENLELYYMYRDLYVVPEDLTAIMKNHLRYDITIIPPGTLGPEHVKTAGHYHPPVPGTKLSYTEIYEVLEGTAHYLLQKEANKRVIDVAWLECKEGDKIIIPPDYGHVTINPSNSQQLKMANWVSRDFKSEYQRYRDNRGGVYYELSSGDWIKNERYSWIPKIRKIKPTNYAEWGLRTKDMYSLIHEVDKLAYLNRPQDYRELFKRIMDEEA